MPDAPEQIATSLARLAHLVSLHALPPDVLSYAKALVLDSIGCLAGGFASEPARATREVAAVLGGREICTIVGARERTSPALAALCNGAALRYLDFNDACSFRDAAHPSGNLPPLLAVAEMQGQSGADLLAALVAGYEIHLRLCEFAGAPSLAERGWHNTTNLQISAAAGAARLLGCDTAQTAQAIAIAATHGNTLAQIQRGEIGAIKATADGWVAKAAVEAALLAKAGVTGPDRVFEGDAGWGLAVAGEIDRAGLTAPLMEFRLMRSRIKAFASVGPSMAPVQAAVELHRAGAFDAQTIEQIVVRLPQQVVNSPSVDERKRYPANRETADHSYHYCVVIALLEGACGPAQFDEAKIHTPHVRELLARVVIEGDAEFTDLRASGVSGGSVELRRRDGSRIEQRVPYPPGHGLNPLTAGQIEAKFDSLTEAMFDEGRRGAIKQAVADLDTCVDLRAFCRLLAV